MLLIALCKVEAASNRISELRLFCFNLIEEGVRKKDERRFIDFNFIANTIFRHGPGGVQLDALFVTEQSTVSHC